MIKVQLCPQEELENKRWFVSDLIVFLGVVAIAVLAMKVQIGEVQLEVDSLVNEKSQFEQRKASLQEQLKKFKTLDEDIANLKSKMEALKSITTSKVAKFRSIVALEHLQVLKPQGVWFRKLTLKDDGSFEIKGGAFDTVLVAEFSLALRETQNKSFVSSDVRSLVFFSDVQIVKTMESPSSEGYFPDIKKFYEFDLIGKISERGPTLVTPGAMLSQVVW